MVAVTNRDFTSISQLPSGQARDYFRYVVQPEIRRRHPDWTPNQVDYTIVLLWYNPAVSREPFVTARNRRATAADAPQVPLNLPIPTIPPTLEDARYLKEDYSNMGSNQPPTMILPPATDPPTLQTSRPKRSRTDSNPAGPPTTPEVNSAQPNKNNQARKTSATRGNSTTRGNLPPQTQTPHPGSYQYPYSFWPPPPWQDDQNVRDLPDLAALTRSGDITDADREAWLNHPSILNQIWRGVSVIGIGTYGVCGLYIQEDPENGNIIDRMVIKENIVPLHSWNDPSKWRNKLPREIHIHKRIEAQRELGSGHLNVVRCRGSRLLMKQRIYRLYLSLYDHGDLFHAMRENFGYWRYIDQLDPLPARVDENRVLPEKYIWHVFRGLVDACLVLQQGRKDRVVDGWRPIMHMDMKLNNVFLRATNDGMARYCPLVVVSDLGLSFYDEVPTDRTQSRETRDNPWNYCFPYDTTYYAPEQSPAYVYGSERDNPEPYTEKTDVWCIGHMLWNLITHRHFTKGPMRDVYLDEGAANLADRYVP
ncbi:kinase-like domain-containing protein [Dendryphion nanum]|uniref:non-specific serine/threonine protein kinase n=1 Tax=Dendryphion nanum TaxID=256645 RepID=A0A9P9IVG4_9PLEO|nr:kinase-like domain-containing protein [Dendryphion nanum]